MEKTGKVLHKDDYLVLYCIHANAPWRLDLHGMIKHRLPIRGLRTYPTALCAAVFGVGLEGQAPHQFWQSRRRVLEVGGRFRKHSHLDVSAVMTLRQGEEGKVTDQGLAKFLASACLGG
jgi:hypothetical protein